MGTLQLLDYLYNLVFKAKAPSSGLNTIGRTMGDLRTEQHERAGLPIAVNTYVCFLPPECLQDYFGNIRKWARLLYIQEDRSSGRIIQAPGTRGVAKWYNLVKFPCVLNLCL